MQGLHYNNNTKLILIKIKLKLKKAKHKTNKVVRVWVQEYGFSFIFSFIFNLAILYLSQQNGPHRLSQRHRLSQSVGQSYSNLWSCKCVRLCTGFCSVSVRRGFSPTVNITPWVIQNPNCSLLDMDHASVIGNWLKSEPE